MTATESHSHTLKGINQMRLTEKWYGQGYSDNKLFGKDFIVPKRNEKPVKCTYDKKITCIYSCGNMCDFKTKTGRMRTWEWDEEEKDYKRDAHGRVIISNLPDECHYYTPRKKGKKWGE